jgi:RNA polymerase sigma factor (sigma-70 family)
MRLNALADRLFDEPDTPMFAPGSEPPRNLDVASRDSISLVELYRSERSRLLRFFGRRVGRDEASALVHESFASLMATMARRPRPIERPEAYLTTIADNLATRHARTAARRSAASHVSVDDMVLAGPDPLAQLEARDVLARLETAMLGLRPLTREIFMAHRLDGYTYREIAARTGLTVKRVEKHMGRAIAQLDDILGAGM